MDKWLLVNYSFMFVLISPTSLVSMAKIKRNFYTKMRLISQINTYMHKRIIIIIKPLFYALIIMEMIILIHGHAVFAWWVVLCCF